MSKVLIKKRADAAAKDKELQGLEAIGVGILNMHFQKPVAGGSSMDQIKTSLFACFTPSQAANAINYADSRPITPNQAAIFDDVATPSSTPSTIGFSAANAINFANSHPITPNQSSEKPSTSGLSAANAINYAHQAGALVPSSTPERPMKKKKPRTSGLPSRLGTPKDPMDQNFCESLYMIGEEEKMNISHSLLRKKCVEVRRTKSGLIFFQCAYCKHIPNRAKQSTLSPMDLKGLYRAFGRFIRTHVPACEHIPQEIKDLNPKATMNEKGSKRQWVSLARKKGFADRVDGKGIIYCKTLSPHRNKL
mmetsp:Transcript_16159/g.34112  ORF Transcript_16159/g.34112 Transcript_16159/m.34112 type:complete len:307 (+) Transcript_16159:134-1054(+)